MSCKIKLAMEKEPQNLMDGLFTEMNRAREIKKMYDEIPQGKFGSIMIQQSIDRAEKSIKDNDVIEMLSAYKELQGIE
jgi:hypothetical protein